MPTAELLNDAGRLEWTAETTMVLDLTTHTSREEVATRIGEKLVQDYMAMAPVLRAVAHEMGVNEVAVGGVSRTGNHTPRHQHAPMGVLNLLGGSEGASKQWRQGRVQQQIAARQSRTVGNERAPGSIHTAKNCAHHSPRTSSH
jgi:hypothetical protein